MEPAIARHHPDRVEVERAAAVVADPATGLFDQQGASGLAMPPGMKKQGGSGDSNPRLSEPQSDALTN